MPDPPLIAVDWGSTNLRATLIAGAESRDRIESHDGIKNVPDGAFELALAQLCGDWKSRFPDAEFILSGMIGSREGWIEVQYADAPASPADLAGRMATMETKTLGPVRIVPGVRQRNADGTFDVMRGEETQATGLLNTLDSKNAIICAPGTHSKWIICRDGRIKSFRTWATGETFQLLSQNSLLFGESAAQSIRTDSEAFRRGLEHSGRSGGLLHHLFLGRTDMLMGMVDREDLVSVLSGILIGHEIREARPSSSDLVHLIASDVVAPVYEAAFDFFEVPFSRCETDVHPAGIAAIRSADA